MEKNKNAKKNWSHGSRAVNEKRSKNKKIKIKFQNSKHTKNVLKFIPSSMPFMVCYLNEPFMS